MSLPVSNLTLMSSGLNKRSNKGREPLNLILGPLVLKISLMMVKSIPVIFELVKLMELEKPMQDTNLDRISMSAGTSM